MYQRARLGIGYLPQEASIFSRFSRWKQNISAPCWRSSNPRRGRREAELNSLLDEFNIAPTAKKNAVDWRCRGGRATPGRDRPAPLLLAPTTCCSDEPFAGIDPIAVGDIQDLVPPPQPIGASAC